MAIKSRIVCIPAICTLIRGAHYSLSLIRTIHLSFNMYQGWLNLEQFYIQFCLTSQIVCFIHTTFRYFGQPLVILMSPQDVPTSFQDYQHHGSLFTLFLHSPLTAVCYICNVGDVGIHHWERCQGYVEKFVTEASCLFTRCRVEDVGKNRDYIGMKFDIIHLFIYSFLFRINNGHTHTVSKRLCAFYFWSHSPT